MSTNLQLLHNGLLFLKIYQCFPEHFLCTTIGTNIHNTYGMIKYLLVLYLFQAMFHLPVNHLLKF